MYQHRGQVLSPTKFSSNGELIPQTHELVKICRSHCKVLYQLELFVVIFLGNLEFYLQIIGIVFGPTNLSKPVLAFAKVNIVGTS